MDLDDFEVWVFAASGVKALQGCLIVPNEFNFDPKFGVKCFVKEFCFAHYMATWLETKGRSKSNIEVPCSPKCLQGREECLALEVV